MPAKTKGLNQEIHISLNDIKITDFVLVLIMLLGTTYSLYVGWKAILGEEAPVAQTSQEKSAVSNSNTSVASQNTLKLNYEPKREGAEINPDALELGKTNPFE